MPPTESISLPMTERRTLSSEITLALSIKLVLMIVLWIAIFRPDTQDQTRADSRDPLLSSAPHTELVSPALESGHGKR